MKKISLFAILGLVASSVLAGTVYYPSNTYKVDGKVQFIGSTKPTAMVVSNETSIASPLITEYEFNQSTGDLDGRVDALEDIVSDSTTGLVTRVSTAENTITNLGEAVYDSTTGLVTRVSAAENTLTNHDEALYDSTTGLVTRVSANETAITNLNNATNNFNEALYNSTTGLVGRVGTIESSYVTTVNGFNGSVEFAPGENVQFTTNSQTITVKTIEQPVRTLKTNTFNASEGNASTTVELTEFAEQYYTWSNTGAATVTINVGTGGDGSNVGYLTLYLDENYVDSEIFDISASNIVGCPTDHFWATNPAESGSQRSTWKIELELVPGSTSWYFKKATEYIIETSAQAEEP